MNQRLFPLLLITAALAAGCSNDDSTQLPMAANPPSISELVKSLIAMVTGGSCNTALPSDINTATVPDDATLVDVNTLTAGCS